MLTFKITMYALATMLTVGGIINIIGIMIS
jgi:hypothetical protein